MISRTDKGNFLTAHYDWVAAVFGVLALLASVAYCLTGGSVEEEVDDMTRRISGAEPSDALVAAVDAKAYSSVTNVTKVKAAAASVAGKTETLFASGKRLRCRNAECGRLTPERLDAAKNLVCSFCGFTQVVAKVEKVLDADDDGLPDAWEKLHGLNPNDPADADADPDKDDFTNREEYAAGTDPQNAADHPDYLDSLKLVLPLKRTYMPFLFVSATPIPKGWRCEFFDPSKTDDYGRRGLSMTAVVGEEVGTSGFVLRKYEKKSVKQAIKGSVNKKDVDVSEVTLERKSDGKSVLLVLAESKKAKLTPIDVQASLTYARRTTQSFDVVPGSEITLSGAKYRIVGIQAKDKGAAVTVESVLTGKKRTLEALEP